MMVYRCSVNLNILSGSVSSSTCEAIYKENKCEERILLLTTGCMCAYL